MIKFVVILAMIFGPWAFASTTRVQVIDTISNSSGGSSLTVPATGSNIVSDTASQSLTNKTISGSSNTLSNLPVQAQFVQDTFVGNGSSTSLTLSFSISTAAGLTCHLDGLLLFQGASNDYTVSGTTVTMVIAPATGQKVICVYSKY